MKIKKIIPLVILLSGTVSFFAFGGHRWLDFEIISEQSQVLHDFVDQHHFESIIIYIVIYLTITALSLPLATLVTLVGGFLFGAYFGTLYTVIGATLGAILIFTAARYALSDFLRGKTEGFLGQLRHGFNENAFWYMLTLRLIPLFPFVVVNIAPALLSVPLRIFAITTFIGIIPGTFVYNSAGAGLADIFASGEQFSPENILTLNIVLAMVGLGLLALSPSVYKLLKKRLDF